LEATAGRPGAPVSAGDARIWQSVRVSIDVLFAGIAVADFDAAVASGMTVYLDDRQTSS